MNKESETTESNRSATKEIHIKNFIIIVGLLSFLTSVEWLRSSPYQSSCFALNLPNLSRVASL